jgi:hypothetical protein
MINQTKEGRQMKDLLTVLEMIIIARVLWKTVRFIRGKKHKKTLLGKVWLLCSRQLHGNLDSRIKEQNKRLADCTRQARANVIQFREYKRKLN